MKYLTSEQNEGLKNEPVAYFCTEYALFNKTSLYAGGLGVLAGDYINEIVEQNLPVVAIGLLYHNEHIREKKKNSLLSNPKTVGLSLVKTEDGLPLTITLPINDRGVMVQVWIWKKSQTSLLLLDTHVEGNKPNDWAITDNLYTENRDERLIQEIVLGIGGMRILKALDIHPSIYHLNEGHSAFLIFELIHYEMINRGVDFAKACEYVKKHVVFTNHTLIPTGLELFNMDRVKWNLSAFAYELNINVADLLNLGFDPITKMFSMNLLALKLSSKVNTVSVLHKKKAMELWKGYEIENITNGINIKSWDFWNNSSWLRHQENKIELIKLIKEQCAVSFSENVLLLGWARRFVEYKRPLAILEDISRFKNLAKVTDKEFRIVFSGPLNDSYNEENPFLKRIYALMKAELKDIVVFLPNYDVEISQKMVSGCDVWLNTPIVGSEACGTSGMKACLNGVLPLTTSDGWVDEIDISNIGWLADNANITDSLMTILENEIIPQYYNHIFNVRENSFWAVRMANARKLIIEQFSTTRMLKEYIEKLYIPAYNNRFH